MFRDQYPTLIAGKYFYQGFAFFSNNCAEKSKKKHSPFKIWFYFLDKQDIALMKNLLQKEDTNKPHQAVDIATLVNLCC